MKVKNVTHYLQLLNVINIAVGRPINQHRQQVKKPDWDALQKSLTNISWRDLATTPNKVGVQRTATSHIVHDNVTVNIIIVIDKILKY